MCSTAVSFCYERIITLCQSVITPFISLLSTGPVPSKLTALIRVLEACRDSWRIMMINNPWQHPPLAVVNAGALAVRNFFTAAFAEGAPLVHRPLKVVLIGKETVGKTR